LSLQEGGYMFFCLYKTTSISEFQQNGETLAVSVTGDRRLILAGHPLASYRPLSSNCEPWGPLPASVRPGLSDGPGPVWRSRACLAVPGLSDGPGPVWRSRACLTVPGLSDGPGPVWRSRACLAVPALRSLHLGAAMSSHYLCMLTLRHIVAGNFQTHSFFICLYVLCRGMFSREIEWLEQNVFGGFEMYVILTRSTRILLLLLCSYMCSYIQSAFIFHFSISNDAFMIWMCQLLS